MALTTQRKEYIYQYAKENLKRIPLDVPKSDYEEIKAHASSNGESVNGFIKRAISETIARDGTEKLAGVPEQSAAIPLSPAQENAAQAVSAPAIAIPLEKLNQAKAHAEARREPIGGFLARAIDETMERDKNAPVSSHGESKEESE